MPNSLQNNQNILNADWLNETIPDHVTRKVIYDGMHQLEFNDKNHRYKINGTYVSGVTSMLARLGKGDGLMQWAVNLALDAYIGGASRDDAKYAHLTAKDNAADIGKRVHAWVEHYLKTRILGMIAEDMKSSVEGFMRWWQTLQMSDIETERILFSEKYNYCGTVDLICNLIVNGRKLRVVGDFKTGSPEREFIKTKAFTGYTGKTRAYVEHFYQCSLYDQALYEETGLQADAYMIIYLSKDGTMSYYITESVAAYHQAGVNVVMLAQSENAVKFVHNFAVMNKI